MLLTEVRELQQNPRRCFFFKKDDIKLKKRQGLVASPPLMKIQKSFNSSATLDEYLITIPYLLGGVHVGMYLPTDLPTV